MSLRLAAIIAITGCGPGTPQPATANRTAPQPDPRGRADRAVRDEERLDYNRPFDETPVDHTRSMGLYIEACRGGDRLACRLAVTVASAGQLQSTLRLVEANCKAGDVMSCRALPADEEGTLRFPSLAGATGRAEACARIDEGSTCDLGALRRECTEGFAASCAQLALARPVVSDPQPLLTRAVELADAGCREAVVSECRLLDAFGSEEQKTTASRRVCDLGRAFCEGVGIRALKQGDKDKARDAFERACQLGAMRDLQCVDVGVMYLDHKLDEPVAGRGQALVDWGCGKMVKQRGKERIERDVPDCKHAKLP